MEILDGIEVDEPHLHLRWGMKVEEISQFPGVTEVASGYFSLIGTALDGLMLRIGLRVGDRGLFRIEFKRLQNMSLADSYRDFQNRLTGVFGPPNSRLPAEGGFDFFEWHRGNITISHSVIERFSLEEHVVITSDID